MKRVTLTVASLALLSAFAHSEVKWDTNLSTALKKAKASKRLIFVDFYADW